MTDTTELFDRPSAAPRRGRGDNRPPSSDLFVLAAGVLISAIVLIVIVLALFGDGDSSVDTTDTSTTETTAESSTTESTTTETTASTSTESVTSSSASTTESTTPSSTARTTTIVDGPETYHTAVWPWFDSTTRFTDPVEAARSFAVDFIGYTDPVVGEFQQGDTRSGEVEVRPVANGPTTIVFVRQLGSDDTWWVLGAAGTNITVDEPPALSEIESPLTVAGSVLAFEGHVDIELRADGVPQPLVETFATGGGDQARPFETTLEWPVTDAEDGALVLTTSSAEDGRVWEASVIRIFFESA